MNLQSHRGADLETVRQGWMHCVCLEHGVLVIYRIEWINSRRGAGNYKPEGKEKTFL